MRSLLSLILFAGLNAQAAIWPASLSEISPQQSKVLLSEIPSPYAQEFANYKLESYRDLKEGMTMVTYKATTKATCDRGQEGFNQHRINIYSQNETIQRAVEWHNFFCHED